MKEEIEQLKEKIRQLENENKNFKKDKANMMKKIQKKNKEMLKWIKYKREYARLNELPIRKEKEINLMAMYIKENVEKFKDTDIKKIKKIFSNPFKEESKVKEEKRKIYQVGNKVKVKINSKNTNLWEMLKFNDRIVTIDKVYADGVVYLIKEDGNFFLWQRNWLVEI